MQNSELNPKLTILIPTRNRAKFLDTCLKRIVRSINYYQSNGGTENIEIVVANNFSNDNTEEIVLNFAQNYEYIKYYKHKEFYKSAEESLFNSIEFCLGDYIWSFGDDDYMHQYAIENIFNNVLQSELSFILLNCDILSPDKRVCQYMRSNHDMVKYDNGQELFNNFGLISATTTISCLVFKKNDIDINLFSEISKISKIYSHSFFLFTTFYNKKVAFFSKPVITYKSNTIEAESSNIYGLSKQHKLLELHSFTIGLLNLIKYVEEKTKINKKTILNFQEVEISKDNWNVKHSLLCYFILRMFVAQLLIIVKYNLIEKIKNKNNINVFLDEFSVFLQEIDNKEFAKKLIIFLSKFRKKNFIIPNQKRKKRHLNKLNEVNNNINTLEDLLIQKTLNYDSKVGNSYLLTKSNIALKTILEIKSGVIDYSFNNEQKLLSIMVPTYQRPIEILKLLIFLQENKINEIKDIEIVFGINHRTGEDYTSVIIESITKDWKNVVMKKFDTFATTAEENINRTIKFCRAQYIFFLGDDDIINIKSLFFALDLLRQGKSDVYIFNSNTEADYNLTFNGKSPGFKNLITIRRNFPKILSEYGITTSMAFISRYIVKKEIIGDMSKEIAISKIYSYIFSFIKFFKNKTITLVSIPIVTRFDSLNGGNERFLELNSIDKVKTYHYWTSGLLAHFINIADLNIVKDSWLFGINERIDENNSFYLWKDIVKNYCYQQLQFLKNQDISEKVSEKDLDILTKISKSSKNKIDNFFIKEVIFYLSQINNLDSKKELTQDIIKKYIIIINQLVTKILSKC